MVFSPSYKFIEEIQGRFDAFNDDVDVIVQNQNMTVLERFVLSVLW